MKKLNKKGTTLVELIISVALISVVLMFMFKLLIDINNDQTNNTFANKNQINRAEIIKTIETDLTNKTIKGINSNGSNKTNLNINFSFSDGSTSKIIATENSFIYKSKTSNNIETTNKKWTIESATLYTNSAKVYYSKDNNFYTLNINIEIHTTNDKNTFNNNNILDDISLSYIGKTSDYNLTTPLTCLGYDC
ncbi:MAG: prepilin-type N-terminal cleavage/methylation domain-containing protein [Clostridia bacterium]